MKISPEIEAAQSHYLSASDRLGRDMATVELLTVVRAKYESDTGLQAGEYVRELMRQTSNIVHASDAK